jgi:hypothetical protein
LATIDLKECESYGEVMHAERERAPLQSQPTMVRRFVLYLFGSIIDNGGHPQWYCADK